MVADKNLTKGHIVRVVDIWARRPGSGEIAGYEFDKVIGKKLKRSIERNTQLKWSDFEE